MNGKKAKRLRKEAYGDDGASSARRYFLKTNQTTLHADEKRQTYQVIKQLYKDGKNGK